MSSVQGWKVGGLTKEFFVSSSWFKTRVLFFIAPKDVAQSIRTVLNLRRRRLGPRVLAFHSAKLQSMDSKLKIQTKFAVNECGGKNAETHRNKSTEGFESMQCVR